jgi:Ca-activated chloride channel family protein
MNIRTSQQLVSRQAPSERFLEVSVTTPRTESSVRAPLNLAIVLDRSGSMAGEKVARAKQAADYVLEQLNRGDRVSIVIYDNEISVIASSRQATRDHLRSCKSALRQVQAGNTTALFDGWLEGCNQVADHIQKGTVSRVLLLTDGLANVGLTNSPTICEHVTALFERGVSTSTFGIGADFDEDLLSDMADAGRGQFYYIEHSGLIPDAFRKEFSYLAAVIASNARLTVDLAPGAQAKLLGGIPFESTETSLVIPVGDLYGGENRPYYFQMEVAAASGSDFVPVGISLNVEQNERKVDLKEGTRFVYASSEEVAAEPVDEDLMQRVADVHIAEARIEAMKLNRTGQFSEAVHVMESRVAAYQDYRPEFMVAEDLAFSGLLAEELDPLVRKQKKAAAMQASRIRSRRRSE